MESINKYEIKGTVGNVRVQKFEDTQVANMSVVTNYIYKGRTGTPMVETFWMNVCAWQGKGMPEDFDSIRKGDIVHAKGRLRDRDYTAADGSLRHITEMIADSLDVIPAEEAVKAAAAEG